jgi:hypothetical protein
LLFGEIVSGLEILRDRYVANRKDQGWKARVIQSPNIDLIINDAGTHATVQIGLHDLIEIPENFRRRLTNEKIRETYMRRWVIPQIIHFLSQFNVRGMKATLTIKRLAIRWQSEDAIEIIVVAEWTMMPTSK